MDRTSLRSIARRYGLRLIVLFGSRARGEARPESDCDICVLAKRLPLDEVRLIGELSGALARDVDLVVFERAGASLKFSVATEGKLLLGRRDDWDRLRLCGIREWQDSGRQLAATRSFLDRALG